MKNHRQALSKRFFKSASYPIQVQGFLSNIKDYKLALQQIGKQKEKEQQRPRRICEIDLD